MFHKVLWYPQGWFGEGDSSAKNESEGRVNPPLSISIFPSFRQKCVRIIAFHIIYNWWLRQASHLYSLKCMRVMYSQFCFAKACVKSVPLFPKGVLFLARATYVRQTSAKAVGYMVPLQCRCEGLFHISCIPLSAIDSGAHHVSRWAALTSLWAISCRSEPLLHILYELLCTDALNCATSHFFYLFVCIQWQYP